MTWIKVISYDDAVGKLKRIYDRIKGPDNNVDNILMAHSLRPHTLEGHMAIYKYVLHHTGNSLSKAFLEAIGTYVSMLNECHYCIDHHYSGMVRLLGDEARAAEIKRAFDQRNPAAAFGDKEAAMLTYAEILTLKPTSLTKTNIETLRELGVEDGEILEINQVAAYFNYANRTVLGLGINTDGDIIGLSPNNSDNPDDWSHK